MNIWSFMTIVNIDITRVSVLRFLWIPILAFASFYWFRRRQMNEEDFSLSLISMYILFMISYSWVSEQSFLDPLPFLFLQTLGYRTKDKYLYGLILVQIMVLMFSVGNWGPFVFQPLLRQFTPSILNAIQWLDPSQNAAVWTFRQIMGLVVSASLTIFLIALAKPSILRKMKKKNIWHLQLFKKNKFPHE